MAATTACCVLPDRWFTPHFAVLTEFALSAWGATVHVARVCSPLWPACWVDCPDRTRRSPSPTVQNIWDVYIREVSFVPFEVREQLFIACNSSDVDASWYLWSREAEACLARVYLTAGGPALSSPGSYVGRSQLSLRTKRLGGRCQDRTYRMNRADEFDVTHSGLFVDSSLAPVLRFRRRFVSVCNVLNGIRVHGFSDARVTALWYRWRAVVRMAPAGRVAAFEPWTNWIPPDLHGFYKWTMDTLFLLNEFVLKVVHHRQTARLQAWSNWIREDLTSHPYQWILIWFANPKTHPMGLGYWSNQLLLMPTFGRHGCPIFVEMGTLLSPLKPFLILLGIIFHRKPFWIFPFLLVRSFMMLRWPRNPLLGVLMAGLGMRLKLFLDLGLSDSPWSSGKLKLLVDGVRVSLMRKWR